MANATMVQQQSPWLVRARVVNLQVVNGMLENHSFGVALQAGLGYKLDKNWLLNPDVKKIRIRSDLTVLGGVDGGAGWRALTLRCTPSVRRRGANIKSSPDAHPSAPCRRWRHGVCIGVCKAVKVCFALP